MLVKKNDEVKEGTTTCMVETQKLGHEVNEKYREEESHEIYISFARPS